MRCVWMLWLVGCGAAISQDGDRDGFLSIDQGGTDCNDADAAVHPEAVEVCGDAVDNDCDGNTDDHGQGSVPWFVDADGDGYGGEASTAQGCPGMPPEAGLAEQGGDCDDDADDVHPGVLVDGCDLVDEDCDTEVDEDASLVTVDGTAHATVTDAFVAATELTGEVVVEICAQDAPIQVAPVRVEGNLTVRSAGNGVAPQLAEAGGGTLFTVAGEGELALVGVVVTGSSGGPAIRVEEHAQFEMLGGEMRANPGGALALLGADPVYGPVLRAELVDVHMVGNGTSARDGGAVRAEGWFDLGLSGVVLEGNFGDRGGAVYLVGEPTGPRLEWRDLELLDNQATSGGALFVEGVSLDLLSSVVRDNMAVGGGGVLLRNSTLLGLGSVEVTGNTATDRAGGVLLEGSTITAVVVSGNHAVEGGGVGIEHASPAAALSLLTRMWIEGNDAQVGAGMQVGYGAAAQVSASTVVANQATQFGGGAYLVGGGGSLTSVATHWGADTGDNTPNDVEFSTGAAFDFAEVTDSFTCTHTTEPQCK